MDNQKKVFTDSGIEIKEVYAAIDNPLLKIEQPGEFPYTTRSRARPRKVDVHHTQLCE